MNNIEIALISDQNWEAIHLAKMALESSQNALLSLQWIEGLIGSGNLKEASQKMLLFQENYLENSPQIIQYARILQGNLLVTEGRYAEALVQYENAIFQPKGEYYYFQLSKIWRELTLAHFGDPKSPIRLKALSLEAAQSNQEYLSMLAATFSLASAQVLGQNIELTESRFLQNAINPKKTPGLMIQALMALVLGESLGAEEQTATIQKILLLSISCQGIKGEISLFYHFRQSHLEKIRNLDNGSEYLLWFDRYIHPILNDQKAFLDTLFSNLPDGPFMHPMNCAKCDGRCCYDGVYITYEEEKAIREFMNVYPEYFKHVPKEFSEEGEWGFLFHGKRTLRVPHEFTKTDFPKHFTQTKCIFAYPDGDCSLQKAATEQGYHPWKYKPASCWEFPMIGLFNDNALEKPHYFGETDPGYCDENNPGYVSFMPCARTFPEGISWKKIYQNEIQYFLYLQSKKK